MSNKLGGEFKCDIFQDDIDVVSMCGWDRLYFEHQRFDTPHIVSDKRH